MYAFNVFLFVVLHVLPSYQSVVIIKFLIYIVTHDSVMSQYTCIRERRNAATVCVCVCVCVYVCVCVSTAAAYLLYIVALSL